MNEKLYILVKQLRKETQNATHSFYSNVNLMANLEEFGLQNRYPIGVALDMAVCEFLTTRGYNFDPDSKL